ncbi:MAG: TatD family hydrolase [Limnobacter sp.]|nr:TatD family hydrolase [Limnobacter sp.]
MLVDSHCHLDFPELADRFDAILENMAANDVSRALCVCVTLPDFPRVLALAERDARLHASVGVHPDSVDTVEPDVETLVGLAAHPKIVAIGETGLDYYREPADDEALRRRLRETQQQRFRVHIRAARATGKPLIVHTRSASADTIRILREEGADQCGGVLHCFTEDWETARAGLDLGLHVSFSGIVTFRNAEPLRQVAAKVPIDRLLVETDSPYLAPVPHRGRTNEPAFVRHVAERVAELKALPLTELADRTTENYFTLFKILQ